MGDGVSFTCQFLSLVFPHYIEYVSIFSHLLISLSVQIEQCFIFLCSEMMELDVLLNECSPFRDQQLFTVRGVGLQNGLLV